MTNLNSCYFEWPCSPWTPDRLLYASASAAVFWLVSSSASVDRPALHPQSRLVLLVVSVLSLDQRPVSQPLPGDTIHKAIEPRQGVIFDVAFVQPEGKFIDVAVEMLLAGVMIDTDQAAFENRENAFDSVCGHIIADIFALTVIDRIMIEGQASNADIRAGFVGVDRRTNLDILKDHGLDRLGVCSGDRHGDRPSATLPHAENWRLADRTTSSLEFLAFVFVGFLAADKRLINFDDAGELLEIGTATGFPQPMQDEPSRLLRDPNFLGELHRGYALAGRHEQVHRVNPLVQRNVAALEYRAGAHREVFLALIAAIEAARALCDPLAQAADRAARAIRPQPSLKIGPRRLLVREHLKKLERRNRALGHRSTLNFWAECTLEKRGSQVYKSQI
jgi:hypothetical protein